MATTSFDKSFDVVDDATISSFIRNAKKPRQISVNKRNYNSDKKKGISLLKQRLSNSKI